MIYVFPFLVVLLLIGCFRSGFASSNDSSDQKMSPFQKNSRIAVIGAGISGVHMASRLKKLGYEKVTILEQTYRIGGKAYTVYRDIDTNQECLQTTKSNGELNTEQCIAQDVGPQFMLESWKEMLDLVKEYGLAKLVQPEGRAVFTDTGVEEFSDWILSTVQKEIDVGNIDVPFFIPAAIAPVWGLLDAVDRYSKMHRELFGTFSFSMPPRPSEKTFKKINMSYGEFLRRYKFDALFEFTKIPITAGGGYGYVPTIPALYGLWLITPSVLHGYVQQSFHTIIEGVLGLSTNNFLCNQVIKLLSDVFVGNNASPIYRVVNMLPDGRQKLFEEMVRQDHIDVRLGCKDIVIDRNLDDDTGPISISYRPRGLPDSAIIQEEYDFLIYSAPHIDADKYVSDLTSEEKKIFHRLQSQVIVTSLYTSDAVPGYTEDPPNRPIAYWADRQNGIEDDGRWIIDLHKATIFGNKYIPRQQLRVAGQFVDDFCEYDSLFCDTDRFPDPSFSQISTRALEELVSDVSQQANNFALLEQFPWPYFHHFDNEAIGDGLPWDLVDLQGKSKTWWVGASACFESSYDVVNYNLMILSKKLWPDEKPSW